VDKVNKSHVIKLYPTESQVSLLKQSCGVARHSYNWALTKWKELCDIGEKPSAYSLIKLQNSIKKDEMPFYMGVSKTAPQYAIHNLETAYKNMWKHKKGYPKFKKKGNKDSYVAIENEKSFKQKNRKIWISRIGWIKCAENLRFEGKVNNVVVKRIADMWFAVINIEVSNSILTLKHIKSDNQAIVGVDLGIKSMIALSDGTIYENPKALGTNLKSLKRLQRGLSRKQKNSNNYKKQQIKISRKHYRIVNIRKSAIHKATSEIVKKYDKIIIESLDIKEMMKNHRLSKLLRDVSLGEITRQFTYKTTWMKKEFVKADRFFASSKLCSSCGYKKESLKLSDRIYKCNLCGLSLDRDINAAINLANYSPTQESGESKACEAVANVGLKDNSGAIKQEIEKLSNKLYRNVHHLKNL
jgi:putative transposase